MLLAISAPTFAQQTCATATTVTPGNFVAPQITGTFLGTCAPNGNTTSPNAIWYSFTPTANGEITISSDFITNDGTTKSNDTRVSVITGNCATSLSCHGGNDDINPAASGGNYLSLLTVPVQSGTTYYIVWDDRWSDKGFDWSLTFNAVSCIRPSAFSVSNAIATNTTTASISWTAAIGNPSQYDIEYGPVGFAQGTGTISTVSTLNGTVSGPAGGSVDYYIRSNCGGSQSGWTGPFRATFALEVPITGATGYAYGFDNVSGYAADGWSGAWATNGTAGNPQAGTQMVFSNSSTTVGTNTDRWLYSRPLYLIGGYKYPISFFLRNFGAPAPQSMTLTAGSQPVPASQTSQIWSTSTFTSATWVQNSADFIVPTTGVYYIGFHHTTPGATSGVSFALDTFNIGAGVLGTQEVLQQKSEISVYPNPTSDLLTIKSTDKIKKVSVYDVSGKKVRVELIDDKIDVRHLQSGTYLLEIQTSSGKQTKKFIKK